MNRSIYYIILVMLLPMFLVARPSKKMRMSVNQPAFSLTTSVAKYHQYQLYEGKEPEQASELSFSPVYENKKLKFTSFIAYSINDKDSTKNDLDDPLLSLSSKSKNISTYLKGRYYLSSSLGASKHSREVNKQYGSLGTGYGLSLDSSALRAPGVNISSSLGLVKAFQQSETNTKEESNVNLSTVSNSIFGYNWKKITASVQFMFVNSLKYNDDISNIYLTSQEVSYSFTKGFATALGHTNKAKTMDEETGDFNIQVLQNESSFFYLRMDISI